MLPTYRSPTEPDLTKRPSSILNKLIVRWIGLAVVVIAFIWFAGPLLADTLRTGRSEFEYPSSTHVPSHPTLPDLEHSNLPPVPSKEEQDIWGPRKNEVRDAFIHAWSGYKKMAYPHDELLSSSGGSSDKLRYFIEFLLSHPIYR